MNQGLQNVLLLVPVFLFSLCVHEFAHAWTAARKGDTTARLAGRLTLHPLAHADMIGTLLLPIVCIYNGWPFFGWAKPVPIDARNFKNPRRDMAIVAAAGPASNMILAVLATGLLAVLVRVPTEAKVVETLQIFSVVSIQVNLMLALFNLIPIPPLDGFMVCQAFLTQNMARRMYRILPYSNLLLLALLLTGGFRIVSIPAMHCFRWLITAATGS